MRKILLFGFIGLAGFAFSCKKKENTPPPANNPDPTPLPDSVVVQTNRNTLIGEYTATWCGPCGSWGKPMMIDVLNTHGEKAIGVELHASSSDKLYAKEAEDIGNYSAFAGYPTFTADLKGDFYPASALKTKIDQNAGQPIQAVLGLHKWFDGGKLKVKARANFKANLSGVYNMALWVIEDSIPDVQAGQSANPYLHNHVYRISANNKIWGTQIANNDASENKTVNLDFEVPMNTKWVQKNLKVIAILFKMNGSTPEAIVNSFEK